jgi:hypothetical protein
VDARFEADSLVASNGSAENEKAEVCEDNPAEDEDIAIALD